MLSVTSNLQRACFELVVQLWGVLMVRTTVITIHKPTHLEEQVDLALLDACLTCVFTATNLVLEDAKGNAQIVLVLARELDARICDSNGMPTSLR